MVLHTTPTITANMHRYSAAESAVFCRTRDAFGALSNMHNGFPLQIDNIYVGSSEALYQALRFPAHPALQAQILNCKNAFGSKQIAYLPAHLPLTRADWHLGINKIAMQAALHLKLSQHRDVLRFVLDEAGSRPIVELSIRDPFWGAVPITEHDVDYLVGHNELGQLWDATKLLSDEALNDWPCGLDPLLLLGRPLNTYSTHEHCQTRSLF